MLYQQMVLFSGLSYTCNAQTISQTQSSTTKCDAKRNLAGREKEREEEKERESEKHKNVVYHIKALQPLSQQQNC